jgi:TonB family protein
MERRKCNPPKKRVLIVALALCVVTILNCRVSKDDPSHILTTFFGLLNQGSYKKAATLCHGDVDPFLLDFTNVVPLRFIDKVVVKERTVSDEKASFYIYLFLKDGRQYVYYRRTMEGILAPGVMSVRKVKDKKGRSEWRVVYEDFWEKQRWLDVSKRIRLNIIALSEQVVRYRDENQRLPTSIEEVWSETIDSIVNPVSGAKTVFVDPDEVKPGVISFKYRKEKEEIDIKGYDVNGELLDYFIVAQSSQAEKAGLLEFFDVPPITMTTVVPEYPESEREKGTEGIVSLQLLIGRDGMVHEVKVERSLSPVFDSVAVQAVKFSVFSPAKRDGRPVAIWYYFPVKFILEDYEEPQYF